MKTREQIGELAVLGHEGEKNDAYRQEPHPDEEARNRPTFEVRRADCQVHGGRCSMSRMTHNVVVTIEA